MSIILLKKFPFEKCYFPESFFFFFFNYKEQNILVCEFILSVIPFPVIPQEQCRDK